jgi:hypothetical protein
MENPSSWNQTGKIVELGLKGFWSSAETQREQAIFLTGMCTAPVTLPTRQQLQE